jgi:hypothetical protein
MAKCTTTQKQHNYLPLATLVALGTKFSQLGVFDAIARQVRIAQRMVKHTPLRKALDALITILADAHGRVEANKHVRPDRALQRAFWS